MYLLRKGAYRDISHTHNKQQVGNKSICTEERGGKLCQLQICVQISVVNGIVPLFNRVMNGAILMESFVLPRVSVCGIIMYNYMSVYLFTSGGSRVCPGDT